MHCQLLYAVLLRHEQSFDLSLFFCFAIDFAQSVHLPVGDEMLYIDVNATLIELLLIQLRLMRWLIFLLL